jgi:hypothetical protein
MLNNKNIINLIIIFLLILVLRCLFYTNKIEKYTDITSNKYVCMYAYYEKNNDYKENFKYFLDNVVLKKNIINNNNIDIDFYIIINGNCTVTLPNESQNIKIIRRENLGFDFGAWSHCIKKYLNKSYDYYIFLNTSVKGPYPENIDWLNKFLDLFKSGPGNIKLVGTSINILENPNNLCDISNKYKEKYKYDGPYTHVQSMFFILDNEGFNILNDEKFFDDEEELNKSKDILYIIINKEIRLSQILLKKGYNINSILSKYKDIDYTKITKNFNPSSEDPYYKNAYFGDTITKKEAIFFKTNRI